MQLLVVFDRKQAKASSIDNDGNDEDANFENKNDDDEVNTV